MNIHLIEKQKFTDKLIELIESKYPESSNIIYTYDAGEKFECKKSQCVKEIKKLKEIDFSLMHDDDKFFVHAFYNLSVLRFLFSNLHKFKRNQLVLICWGADIYDQRLLLENSGFQPRTRFYEMLKKRIIKSCNVFMTFACADIKIIRQYYGGSGEQFDCLYPSNIDIGFLDKIKADSNNDGIVRILLGNSATRTNQHIQALDSMSNYKDENIEILCPLSYGDKEYAQIVIEYGRKIFGNKFKPILDYMSPEEYTKLLNSVQVAVFNHNRQQGTGNIEILSYLGKKLFIRSDTTTWEHYVERDKCKFFDTKEIANLSFIQFTTMSKEDIQVNYDYFRKIWDIDYIKSLWDDVISYKG